MERKKLGRPKSKEPTRDKHINFRVTEQELEKAQKICDQYNLTYAEIFLEGLRKWSEKK